MHRSVYTVLIDQKPRDAWWWFIVDEYKNQQPREYYVRVLLIADDE